MIIEGIPSTMDRERGAAMPDDVENFLGINYADGNTSVVSRFETEKLIKKNRSAVNTMKIVYVASLTVVVSIIGYTTFHLARRSEVEAFRLNFRKSGERILHQFYQLIPTYQMNAYTESYAISRMESSTNWPYVTVPDFGLHMYSLTQLPGVTSVFLAPILGSTSMRTYWENYTSTSMRVLDGSLANGRSISDGIYWDNCLTLVGQSCQTDAPYSPVWHVAPERNENQYLMGDQFKASDNNKQALEAVMERKTSAISKIVQDETGSPSTTIFTPIFSSQSDEVVGTLSLLTNVSEMLTSLYVPITNISIHVVLEDRSDGQLHTFEIMPNEKEVDECVVLVKYLGPGDLHSSAYNDMAMIMTDDDKQLVWEQCKETIPPQVQEHIDSIHPVTNNIFDSNGTFPLRQLDIRVYPTARFESSFVTMSPLYYSLVVSFTMVLTILLFLTYSFFAEERQREMLDRTRHKNATSRALVRSFFPSVVRERVVRSVNIDAEGRGSGEQVVGPARVNQAPIIAELFPNTTVMFADISGFTAWSSQREPQQVFNLLENLFQEFDTLAQRLGAFKVETIGDCYVAATGLPTEHHDHAILATRFANECISAMHELTQKLEEELGPGTADLTLRVGLHSGPVTGGVLRGEKARFQLFGDTMNTASRMESNGVPGRIHVSRATADLLIEGGKQHWLVPRKKLIKAKGKGEMQTFYVKPRRRQLSSDVSFDTLTGLNAKREDRLVQWNAELLTSVLTSPTALRGLESSNFARLYDEYRSNIRLQILGFLHKVSTFFPDRPYHNFDHASLSAMFASKLMKTVAKSIETASGRGDREFARLFTLAHFTVIFGVLLRDLQHSKEHGIHSGANVVTLIHETLEKEEFQDLRSAILPSEGDDFVFHNILTEVITKPDLMASQFLYRSDASMSSSSLHKCIEATSGDGLKILPLEISRPIAIVIKSSGVAQWLQHSSVFEEWYKKLFEEVRQCYIDGESLYDPCSTWHKDQKQFLQNQVLPLARMLAENGFGGQCSARADENLCELLANGEQITTDLRQSTSNLHVTLL